MKYSAYHSPSVGRIRRTKYYSTYPRSQKSAQPFRRAKSLNLKRRSLHSTDSGTQTDASINELNSSERPRFLSEINLYQPNQHSDCPEFLPKLNSRKLSSECSCSSSSKCSIAACNRLSQTKHDCVICCMWSYHVQIKHSDKETVRPRFVKKNQTMSKIRSFLKGNLKKYSSTQVSFE